MADCVTAKHTGGSGGGGGGGGGAGVLWAGDSSIVDVDLADVGENGRLFVLVFGHFPS